MTVRKIKIGLLFIILGLIALTVYQNQENLIELSFGLNIDLGLTQIPISEKPVYVHFILCFTIGFLISFYLLVLKYFRTKKLIKEYEETISTLKNEIDVLKSNSSADIESVEVQKVSDNIDETP